MSDVFISYSRLDKDFVGKLRDALANQKQEVWIDWESIPPSQTWWSEIQKGIARANNFVVVLSPNSVASPICQMEIEYARELGKRIIPVLHMDYNRDDAIKAIATRLATPSQYATRTLWGNRQPHDLFDTNEGVLKHINYFFFRSDDDFAARFAALLDVIRTDHAHKERHTTLELRALEWNRRERDVSFLLIENELMEAETWLENSAGKEPQPTDIQREYIVASKRRTRQLRSIRRAASVGTIVAIIALMVALSASYFAAQLAQQADSEARQASTAIAARNIAEAQQATAITVADLAATREAEARAAVVAANATSTPLAATVVAAQEQIAALVPTLDVIRAEFVAAQNLIEAQRLASFADIESFDENYLTSALLSVRALNLGYTPRADYNLTRALTHYFGTYVLASTDGSLITADYSPNGTYIFAVSLTGKTLIWEVESRTLIRVLDGAGVSFSGDERTLLIDNLNGTSSLIDTATWEQIVTVEGEMPSLSPSGDILVTLTKRPTPTETLWEFSPQYNAWDTSSFELLYPPITYDYPMSAQLFSYDGQYLIFPYIGTLLFHSAYTGSEVLVAQTEFSTLPRPEFEDFASVFVPFENNNACSDSGQQLLAFNSDRTLRLLAPTTSDIVRELSFRCMAPYSTPDSGLFVIDEEDNLMVYQLNSEIGSLLPYAVLYGAAPRNVSDVFVREFQIAKFSPDERSVIAVSSGERDGVIVWDIENTTPSWTIPQSNTISSAAISFDGRTIAVGDEGGVVQLFSSLDRSLLREFFTSVDGPVQSIASLSFSPDGRTLAVGSIGGTVSLWDTETGRNIVRWQSDPELPSNPVSFSVPQFANFGGGPSLDRVTFARNGELILTLGRSFGIYYAAVWVPSSGELIHSFVDFTSDPRVPAPNFNGPILAADISPDGTLVAINSLSDTDANEIVIWDVSSGEVHSRINMQADSVLSLEFSQDSRRLLIATSSGIVELWNLDTKLAEYSEPVAIGIGLSQAQFNDDETEIIVLDENGDITIWSLSTQTQIRQIYSGSEPSEIYPRFLASSDMGYIVTFSDRQTITLTPYTYLGLVDQACQRLQQLRDLSDNERRRFGVNETPTCVEFESR